MKSTPYSLKDWSDVKDELGVLHGDPLASYDAGFVGAYYDGEEEERLQSLVTSSGEQWLMGDIATGNGFAGQGSGKVILLHKEVEKVGWVAKMGYPNQKVGDCVSHGVAKAIGYTLCCSVSHGNGSIPETGGIESKMWPVASESHYWYRGRSSDGWYAAAALRVVKEKTGIVIRKDIPGACDLREYSASTAHRFGAHAPPEEVRQYLDDNPVLTYSKCESYEEIIDALSAGFGIVTDGGEGFAKTVDENCVARRQGSWSHSMSAHGFCDTPAFKQRYGCGGLCISNSWGAWNDNSNGTVMGTGIKLPAGSFIALWNDIKNRSFFAISDVKGWPNRRLPSWDVSDLL